MLMVLCLINCKKTDINLSKMKIKKIVMNYTNSTDLDDNLIGKLLKCF